MYAHVTEELCACHIQQGTGGAEMKGSTAKVCGLSSNRASMSNMKNDIALLVLGAPIAFTRRYAVVDVNNACSLLLRQQCAVQHGSCV